MFSIGPVQQCIVPIQFVMAQYIVVRAQYLACICPRNSVFARGIPVFARQDVYWINTQCSGHHRLGRVQTRIDEYTFHLLSTYGWARM